MKLRVLDIRLFLKMQPLKRNLISLSLIDNCECLILCLIITLTMCAKIKTQINNTGV